MEIFEKNLIDATMEIITRNLYIFMKNLEKLSEGSDLRVQGTIREEIK